MGIKPESTNVNAPLYLNICQCKKGLLATAVMWYLWSAVKWEECGEDFQILRTARL
jgi:hypothetical protein